MKKTLLLFLIISLFLLFFGTEQVKAGAGDNVSGWAWSSNIGWISFNSTNCDADGVGGSDGAPAGCPPAGTAIANYGVNIDSATGNMSGYAWSGNIGWISFNTADLADCPTAPCEAEVDLITGEVSGWARVLAYGDGWDGWIKMRGTATDGSPYKVSIDTATGEFSGWAWSDMVIGWISFKGDNYGATTDSDLFIPPNQPPTASISCDVTCNGPGCECNGSWITYNGEGVLFHIINDSDDPDDNIIKSTWSIISVASGLVEYDTSCSLPANPLCNLTMPKMFDGDYTINLTVEDATGLTNSVSRSLTVKQDAVARFACSLDNETWQDCKDIKITIGEVIYFRDDHITGTFPLFHSIPSQDATAIISRSWSLNEDVFNSGNNSNASTTFTQTSNTVVLFIEDNLTPAEGRTDSKKIEIQADFPLPKYREVAPFIWMRKLLAGIISFINHF